MVHEVQMEMGAVCKHCQLDRQAAWGSQPQRKRPEWGCSAHGTRRSLRAPEMLQRCCGKVAEAASAWGAAEILHTQLLPLVLGFGIFAASGQRDATARKISAAKQAASCCAFICPVASHSRVTAMCYHRHSWCPSSTIPAYPAVFPQQLVLVQRSSRTRHSYQLLLLVGLSRTLPFMCDNSSSASRHIAISTLRALD